MTLKMNRKQSRAYFARYNMTDVEREMLTYAETGMYAANEAGDPHHWERSSFGAFRTALVTIVAAVIDAHNPNVPTESARAMAKQVVEHMIVNHESAEYNLNLMAKGII